MEQHNSDTMMQRLERLERENRSMKRTGIAALACLCFVALIGATSAKNKTVEAQNFIVKDAQGRTLADFGLRADGMPKMELYDNGGRSRAVLSSLPDGSAALVIHGTDGKRLAVSTIGTGAIGFTMFDKDSRPRAEFSVQRDDSAHLMLMDSDQKVLWQAGPAR